MKKIFLHAYTGVNFGDDMLIRVLCERYPDVRFYLPCPRQYEAPFRNISNLTVMNRSHFRGAVVHTIRRILNRLPVNTNYPFDGSILIGGSMFMQPKNWKPGDSYEKGLYGYQWNEHLPFFILGVNFGPYTEEAFAELHTDFFSRVPRDVCFRDRWSYQKFAQLPNVRYAPDIVCAFQPPSSPIRDTVVISCIRNDGRTGVSVLDNDRYLQKMALVCNEYLRMGKQVCLLSLCEDQGDGTMCHQIAQQCSGPVQVLSYRGNLDEVVAVFSRAEYVIASRFHAMVLAWLTYTPVFPIAYNCKTEHAISAYGFPGEYCMIDDFYNLDFCQIDGNRLCGYSFDIPQLQHQAQEQFSALDAFLNESPRGVLAE